MKLTIAFTALFSLFLSASANEVYKFSYKENSNNAFIESYWPNAPCIEFNSFAMFLSDGFVKQTGSKKETFKSVSGSATLFSSCNKKGAVRTDINFYSTEPVTGLNFSTLSNVTVATNMTAFFTKTQCVIQSYEYPGFESGESETSSYYVCGDQFSSGTRPLSIDTVINLTQNFTSEYSSTNKGVNSGPGYLVKYESKARCKSAAPTKNVITFFTKTPIVLKTEIGYTYGDICKVQSGFSERIVFDAVA